MQIAPGKKKFVSGFLCATFLDSFWSSRRLALTEQSRNTVRPWNLYHCEVEELLYTAIARMRLLFILESFWGSSKIEEVRVQIISHWNVATFPDFLMIGLLYVAFNFLGLSTILMWVRLAWSIAVGMVCGTRSRYCLRLHAQCHILQLIFKYFFK